MISSAAVQAAVIQSLKANVPLVAYVATEIREDNWMGTNFKYPAIRVAVTRVGPMPGNNGICYYTISECYFSLYCYTEGTSSKANLQLLDLARTASEGVALPNFTCVVLPTITSIVEPMPEGERLWRGEVQIRTVVKTPA